MDVQVVHNRVHALDGGRPYRLHIPPNPPAKLFWSVTLYDLDTRSLILNQQEIADRSSRMDLKNNGDGSVDVYCGPKAPEGFEQNWIPTVPGKGWFSYFRLYEPTEAYFDASWKLPAAKALQATERTSRRGRSSNPAAR